jgi:hypothetical protein
MVIALTTSAVVAIAADEAETKMVEAVAPTPALAPGTATEMTDKQSAIQVTGHGPPTTSTADHQATTAPTDTTGVVVTPEMTAQHPELQGHVGQGKDIAGTTGQGSPQIHSASARLTTTATTKAEVTHEAGTAQPAGTDNVVMGAEYVVIVEETAESAHLDKVAQTAEQMTAPHGKQLAGAQIDEMATLETQMTRAGPDIWPATVIRISDGTMAEAHRKALEVTVTPGAEHESLCSPLARDSHIEWTFATFAFH